MTMVLIPMLLTASLVAQVPNPTPAINAAKDAKAKTEAAQQKNAEALDPQRPAPPAPGQRPARAPACSRPACRPRERGAGTAAASAGGGLFVRPGRPPRSVRQPHRPRR